MGTLEYAAFFGGGMGDFDFLPRVYADNEPLLLDQAMRMARAIADAEVQRRSGALITLTPFMRGKVKRFAPGVVFVFGNGRPLGEMLKEGFLAKRNEVY